MEKSYSDQEIQEWLKLTPEQRLLEAEGLWEEFLIKYPNPRKPFWKSFDSFEAYERWLKEQRDPTLW